MHHFPSLPPPPLPIPRPIPLLLTIIILTTLTPPPTLATPPTPGAPPALPSLHPRPLSSIILLPLLILGLPLRPASLMPFLQLPRPHGPDQHPRHRPQCPTHLVPDQRPRRPTEHTGAQPALIIRQSRQRVPALRPLLLAPILPRAALLPLVPPPPFAIPLPVPIAAGRARVAVRSVALAGGRRRRSGPVGTAVVVGVGDVLAVRRLLGVGFFVGKGRHLVAERGDGRGRVPVCCRLVGVGVAWV